MTYVPGSSGTSKVSTSADVALNNPADKEVLTYDAALAKWQNKQLPSSITGTGVASIIKLTQAEYDAIATKSETTLYVIQG
ncbi:hypothetical protein CYG49_01520 [Candidatus Saccharibacteria bacterium]|nr:MAG: hypothetical protein CYG49_01520 [Candidatus Saccharibacteria bacterium]